MIPTPRHRFLLSYRLHWVVVIIFLSLLSASLHAQTLTWSVETSRPAPADWPIFQGETITLEPRFVSYGKPLDLADTTATLYWSTNLTDHAWWSAPATIITGEIDRVQATWQPEMDVGAPRYHYFIGLAKGAAIAYRAHGTLTMRSSPGYSPAALPPPTASWVTQEQLEDALSGVEAVIEEQDPVAVPLIEAHIESSVAHLDIRAEIHSATNYIVQQLLLTTNSYLTISNGTLTIWRDLPDIGPESLWSSEESKAPEIDAGFTNALWQALGILQNDVDGKAPKAWGDLAPDGSPNPDPLAMLWLNRPATVQAAGFSWENYGSMAFLTTTGTTAYETGGDGSYRVGPGDGTNWFGFVQGGQITIGAIAQSFRLNHDGTASIDYHYSGGDWPILWHSSQLLPATWSSIDNVVAWVDNENGTATATVPAAGASGFFKATTTFHADNYFVSTMPARLTGGVVGATNQLPVKYNSTITINSGGQNYRIPAERLP